MKRRGLDWSGLKRRKKRVAEGAGLEGRREKGSGGE